MFISYFAKFLQQFSKHFYYELFFLIVLSVVCGFLEFLGVAVVFPLIILMLNPEKIQQFPILERHELFLNENIVLYLGGVIIFAFVVKNIIMIYKSYYQFNFLKEWQEKLNLSIFKKYIYSSYETVLSMPTKYSIFQVWAISTVVFNNFITMMLNLVSNLIVLSILMLFLLWKFGVWSVITGAFFLISGLLQNKFFKDKGRLLTKQKVDILSTTNNSFLSVVKSFKDIKLFGKENYFYNSYKIYFKRLGRIDSLINFFNTIPQNIVEICIIISIIIMCYGVVQSSENNVDSMVASFSLLAAAMFRMAPIINKLQSNLNFINMSKPAVEEFFNAYDYYDNISSDVNTDESIDFNNQIKIKNLGYSYQEKRVLDNINLEIKKGEFVGIIGKSGVGKSTFLDVLMGVLSSYSGEISVDCDCLDKTILPKWTNIVGYVPQEVSVLPVSIAENIAFGVEKSDIDYEKLKKIVSVVQLDEFVSGLKNGLDEEMKSIAGLSVGQKQRIGLARALYKEAQVLFLDEFTSSLDLATENKIIECLNSLKGKKTIIAIAHRLSTLKKCDRILYFKSSKEVLSGSFNELANKDEEFKELVELASVGDIIEAN